MESIQKHHKVLVSPLGWGLGHATRLIPIIDNLLGRGCEVIIGGDEHVLKLLQPRYPNVKCIAFPSVNVKFASGSNQLLALIRIAFQLFRLTVVEHKELKRLVHRFGIDVVISDNRYGLHAKGVKSILITHQLNPIFPKPFGWLQPLGRWYIRRNAKKFDSCLIPDSQQEFKLTGRLNLGVNRLENAQFIGLLSRFHQIQTTPQEAGYDLVAVISGPPPHRDILEQELISLAKRLQLKTLIVQGLPKGQNETTTEYGVTLASHLEDKELALELVSAKYVICRSGYSTIMDLIALNRYAMLIPSPGQTEQEYLAHRLDGMGGFIFCSQNDLKNISKESFEKLQREPSDLLHPSFFKG